MPGTVATVATSDSTYVHAVQAIFNGASSTFYLDGSSNSTSAGAASTASPAHFMSDGANAVNGHMWEVGNLERIILWTSALFHEQQPTFLYWGF